MTTGNKLLLALTPAVLAVAPVLAENTSPSLSLTPNFLSVEISEDDHQELEEARFNSGLGLALSNDVLQVKMDYQVQSRLKETAAEAQVSQVLGASIHSSALNQLLGLDAKLKAGSTIKQGGDAYVYSVTPGISKSLADLGRFSWQYEYLLDKAGTEAVEKEKLGYSMGLAGSARDGRLTWKGDYRSTDVFGGVDQLQSTESLSFQSSYQLVPQLQLEVSGRSRDEVKFDGGLANDTYSETRYGAGLAWSPSRQYSLAFKVNKLEESSEREDEVFGSGTVTWFPRRDMEFTLSYGDHLVEGARGLMLSTKIDLNDH